MTLEQQQAAQARCDAATTLPWRMIVANDPISSACAVRIYNAKDEIVIAEYEPTERRIEIYEYIVNATTDLPLALAEIRRLTAEVERLKGATP